MDATWFKDPGPDDLGFNGKCNARKRAGAPTGPDGTVGSGGLRCLLKAGYRTSHDGVGPCCFHGGATPQATAKYERVQAGRLLHAYGIRREGNCDPRDVVMEELQLTNGNVDFLHLALQDLTEGQLLGDEALPAELRTGADKDGEHWELVERYGLPVILALYQWERSHRAKLATEAVKLGLLERAVRVEEAQAALIAAAFNAVLEEAGFGGEVADRLKASLVARLSTLEVKAG